MTASPTEKPPTWYWVVSVLLLVWMSFGIMAFVMDLMATPEQRAQMTEAQQQLIASRPTWLFYVYGLATGSGLLGAIGLVMRKQWAVLAFTISFITVLFQMGYILFGLDAIGILGASTAVPFPLVIAVIGGVAVWFSRMVRDRGWIN